MVLALNSVGSSCLQLSSKLDGVQPAAGFTPHTLFVFSHGALNAASQDLPVTMETAGIDKGDRLTVLQPALFAFNFFLLLSRAASRL